MDNGFRKRLKGLVPEKTWPLLRWFDKQLIYCLYIWLWAKRVFVYPRIPVCAKCFGSQSISKFPVTIDYNSAQPGSFFSQLKSQGYTVFEGRHSIYLGDSGDIERFCPGFLERYPKNVGLKIVKSLAISNDSTPYYTSRKIAPASTWFSMRAVGSMLEKMTVSNLLYLEGVAPRVYDIVQLTTNQGIRHYAFVVEHIQGSVLTGLPASEFMKSFKMALNVNGMKTVSIKEHRDLRPPEYNRNIMAGDSSTCYVDIQNFVLSDKERIEQVIGEKKNYLWSPDTYQTIVKRIGKTSVSFRDQKILLLGNYSAGLLPNILSNGARWCSAVLQDEDVLESYEKALYLYGMSRFDLLNISKTRDWAGTDLLLSEYDLICLDINASAMYGSVADRLSASAYLLFIAETEHEVNSLQYSIVDLSMKKLIQGKVLLIPGSASRAISLYRR